LSRSSSPGAADFALRLSSCRLRISGENPDRKKALENDLFSTVSGFVWLRGQDVNL
jgi:hypothetical protein